MSELLWLYIHNLFSLQVEAALTSDPTNAELVKLKGDLLEVITLTDNLIDTQGLYIINCGYIFRYANAGWVWTFPSHTYHIMPDIKILQDFVFSMSSSLDPQKAYGANVVLPIVLRNCFCTGILPGQTFLFRYQHHFFHTVLLSLTAISIYLDYIPIKRSSRDMARQSSDIYMYIYIYMHKSYNFPNPKQTAFKLLEASFNVFVRQVWYCLQLCWENAI